MLWLLYLAEFCLFIPLANHKRKENRCSSYTKGEITSVSEKERQRWFRKTVDYIPTVSFQVQGRRYEVSLGKSGNEHEFQIGQECWILYNPNDPTDVFQDDSFSRLKAGLAAGFGVFTLLFTLFCQFVL